uniref:Derlin-3 isoform X1 n=1 Tax=Phascolarctos cinereus TaxID=38626 RepID=A0A6P5JGB5_PHACI|nr:derlin-3 isoform X1 [Phascolarctos cinereus]XP_020833314.1 derlin-3 isoform X1 [Phascolarctos cinereus]
MSEEGRVPLPQCPLANHHQGARRACSLLVRGLASWPGRTGGRGSVKGTEGCRTGSDTCQGSGSWGRDGAAGPGGRVLAGAGSDARLHGGLRADHRGRAAGAHHPLPALLQPGPHLQEVPGVEARHQLPLLRAPGIQLFLQHAFPVQVLPHAGGRIFPGTDGGFCLHVSLWGSPHDTLWAPGQPLLPGPGLHHHAGVCVEPAEPGPSDELFWPPQLPGALPALGAHGLLAAPGQLRAGGPAGKLIFDDPEEDPNYRPLPEEQPGMDPVDRQQ